MVKQGVFVLLLTAPFVVNAITAEELRRIAGDADRAKRERDHRIKATDLTSLLSVLQKRSEVEEDVALEGDSATKLAPEKKETVPVSKSRDRDASGVAAQQGDPGYQAHVTAPEQVRTLDVPHSTKYGGASSQAAPISGPGRAGIGVKSSSGGERVIQSPALPSYVYVPPARYTSGSSSGSSSNSDVVVVKQRKFGIRIGAWFSGHMSRETTNSDPGLIEIRITEDVVGDHRMLPVGTMLFASKGYNAGTKRLDLKIVQGVLPSGEEIELNGLVYDSSRVAGLPGIVVENDVSVASTGFKKGVIDAGRVIASTIAGGSPAGIVLDSTVGAVVAGKQAATSAAEVAFYTVHVSPQPVLVQVQSTF